MIHGNLNGWRLALRCKYPTMPSPLVILASLSVVVGILGSVFIFLAISVDSWEEIDFSAFDMTNSSTLEITPATSRSDVTVYKELASGTNYFLYYQYGGPWKLCDLLTGKYYNSNWKECVYSVFSCQKAINLVRMKKGLPLFTSLINLSLGWPQTIAWVSTNMC